jgi:vesicle-associated membrane protein 4
MRQNIQKVLQRGELLDSLQDNTNHLAISSQQFRSGANKVRKEIWWKYIKKRIYLALGIVLLLIVLIVPPVITLLLRH